MAASEPTSRLFLIADNLPPFTLNRYFWTLTQGWVVPLSDIMLITGALLPGVYAVVGFGVGQNNGSFRNRIAQSVALPRRPTQPGLSYRIFREEPAIARLDWFFATNRRSEECFDRNTPTDLQPAFGRPSSCPRLDRLASGLTVVTLRFINGVPRSVRNCALFAFASVAPIYRLSLATPINSPLSYSKLTLQHWIALPSFLRKSPFGAVADFGC